MTDQHPITPPPELVQQWFLSAKAMPVDQWVTDVATAAARWGADQELEACCALAEVDPGCGTKFQRKNLVLKLMAARRPKPLSLKELALEVLERSCFVNQEDETIIRHALEQIDD